MKKYLLTAVAVLTICGAFAQAAQKQATKQLTQEEIIAKKKAIAAKHMEVKQKQAAPAKVSAAKADKAVSKQQVMNPDAPVQAEEAKAETSDQTKASMVKKDGKLVKRTKKAPAAAKASKQ